MILQRIAHHVTPDMTQMLTVNHAWTQTSILPVVVHHVCWNGTTFRQTAPSVYPTEIPLPTAPSVYQAGTSPRTVQCVYLDETYPQDVPPVWLDSLEVTVNLVSDLCLFSKCI